MDDSIFIDLVKALITYEKEDKEREPTRKVRDKDDKDKKDSEPRADKTADVKELKPPGRSPSMQIFNVFIFKIF